MKFELTPKQKLKLDEWLENTVYPKAIELQKMRRPTEDEGVGYAYDHCWRNGQPYYGAIGGGLTFFFIPTSIGDMLRVRESITGEEIDLTNEGNFG